jgi:uncharacterized small protein (DUF1192 family)
MIANMPENHATRRHGALSASSIAFDLRKAEDRIAALKAEIAELRAAWEWDNEHMSKWQETDHMLAAYRAHLEGGSND